MGEEIQTRLWLERKQQLGRPICRWDDNSKMAVIKILGVFGLYICKSGWGRGGLL
jgi:hypothetical protein